MTIQISSTFDGYQSWNSKMQGVVLVEKQEDIEPLWQLLCEQDSYWENYKELIKVAPKTIKSEEELKRLCEYCGKTDIYDVKKLQQIIPFVIYQYRESDCHCY